MELEEKYKLILRSVSGLPTIRRFARRRNKWYFLALPQSFQNPLLAASRQSACLFLSPHATALLPLDGVSETSALWLLLISAEKIEGWLKSDKNDRLRSMKMKTVPSIEMSGTAHPKTQHFISEAMRGHNYAHRDWLWCVSIIQWWSFRVVTSLSLAVVIHSAFYVE